MNKCKYIISAVEFSYCGEDTLPNSVYCLKHQQEMTFLQREIPIYFQRIDPKEIFPVDNSKSLSTSTKEYTKEDWTKDE